MMTKHLTLLGILVSMSVLTFAQTNRINHLSHSGSVTTIEIFKSNDHMGLNCGAPYNNEYTPDTSQVITIDDSVFLDTVKPKVCTPTSTLPTEKPRRGLSLERNFNAEDVLGKFK